jgi:hypothetical protein
VSAPQFTPGPWEAHRHTGGQKGLTVEASGLPLLKMYSGRNEEANARLIAAAPELFDGLERAFVFVCHLMPLGSTDNRTEAGKLIDSLRVPLAKARGEGATAESGDAQ